MNKKLGLILLIITFYSCDNKKYFTEYYPNGNMKVKVEINKDSLQIGTYEDFYESGELKSKTTYSNGKISDTFYKFYRNGKIQEKGLEKNNFLNGWWLYYDSNGKLKEKSEFIIVKDSLYKNQSYYYDKNGNIKIEPSTFFELEISDTLRIGKNAGRIKNYVTNFNNREANLLSVIIDNENSEKEIKKDTFGNGTLKPFFGVTIFKTGKQKIKGKILEKVLTKTKEDNDLYRLTIVEHYKYFEKEVYVWDKEKETELGKKLREEMIADKNN
ncbi:toxin-antitoxin system YwqK family antitoxin [Xanthomarina sp. GH4-25]|uniref:toxin-antitoxin system YwqK family antitoxin n=1 Tax=Xanthomarina sp. GH4-25 TaxID=3349335 RepID=UPI003877FC5D